MYNKTLFRFGVFDIQNNRGFGRDYQPQLQASADNPCPNVDYSGYHNKPHSIIVYNDGDDDEDDDNDHYDSMTK